MSCIKNEAVDRHEPETLLYSLSEQREWDSKVSGRNTSLAKQAGKRKSCIIYPAIICDARFISMYVAGSFQEKSCAFHVYLTNIWCAMRMLWRNTCSVECSRRVSMQNAKHHASSQQITCLVPPSISFILAIFNSISKISVCSSLDIWCCYCCCLLVFPLDLRLQRKSKFVGAVAFFYVWIPNLEYGRAWIPFVSYLILWHLSPSHSFQHFCFLFTSSRAVCSSFLFVHFSSYVSNIVNVMRCKCTYVRAQDTKPTNKIWSTESFTRMWIVCDSIPLHTFVYESARSSIAFSFCCCCCYVFVYIFFSLFHFAHKKGITDTHTHTIQFIHICSTVQQWICVYEMWPTCLLYK